MSMADVVSPDVLMIWHSFLLNPGMYDARCAEAGTLRLLDIPFPWASVVSISNLFILSVAVDRRLLYGGLFADSTPLPAPRHQIPRPYLHSPTLRSLQLHSEYWIRSRATCISQR